MWLIQDGHLSARSLVYGLRRDKLPNLTEAASADLSDANGEMISSVIVEGKFTWRQRYQPLRHKSLAPPQENDRSFVSDSIKCCTQSAARS